MLSWLSGAITIFKRNMKIRCFWNQLILRNSLIISPGHAIQTPSSNLNLITLTSDFEWIMITPSDGAVVTFSTWSESKPSTTNVEFTSVRILGHRFIFPYPSVKLWITWIYYIDENGNWKTMHEYLKSCLLRFALSWLLVLITLTNCYIINQWFIQGISEIQIKVENTTVNSDGILFKEVVTFFR